MTTRRPRPTHAASHRPGLDPLGHGLPITIRIALDGRVLFQDITPALLPVALALDPASPDLLGRSAVAQQARFDVQPVASPRGANP